MFAHVRRFVSDTALAEELTQEVFVRVYTTKSYTPEQSFKAWLYRVATNVCLNELRRARHGAVHESLGDDDGAPRELPSVDALPDEKLAGDELARRVRGRLDALPSKQRAAFLMVRQDGLSHEEIAEALDTSVSAVKSLVHRALDALRREVQQAMSDEPPMKVTS